MMVIPVLVYMALFKYLPMYYLRAAFYDFKLLKGFEGSKYVGTKWFERLLSSPELWQYIRNTLSLNLLSLAICFPAPLIFALLLNEVRNVPYKKVVQTISYMPHFVSTVVLVSMINNILSPSLGTLAKIYKLFGLTPVNFLSIPDYFYGINIVSGVWQTMGWNAIIYISAISGIDMNLYEAAKIDGAGRWKQTLHVTIPGLIPTVVLLSTLAMGNVLNAFGRSIAEVGAVSLVGGNIQWKTRAMTTAIMLETNKGKFSFALALGMILLLIAFIVNALASFIVKEAPND